MPEQQSEGGLSQATTKPPATNKSYFKCIVCGYQLYPWNEKCQDDTNVAVNNGVHFQAMGNFGSRVWDLPDRPDSHLEIVICDWCLNTYNDHVRVYLNDGSTRSFERVDLSE